MYPVSSQQQRLRVPSVNSSCVASNCALEQFMQTRFPQSQASNERRVTVVAERPIAICTRARERTRVPFRGRKGSSTRCRKRVHHSSPLLLLFLLWLCSRLCPHIFVIARCRSTGRSRCTQGGGCRSRRDCTSRH